MPWPAAFTPRMITPCGLQLPPSIRGASQMSAGGPPSMLTRLSLFTVTNAISRLSGDQKGDDAPSVPAILRAVTSERERTQIIRSVPGPEASTATRRPSGDRAIGEGDAPPPVPATSAIPSGSVSENDTASAAGGVGRRKLTTPDVAAMPSSTPAPAAPSQGGERRGAGSTVAGSIAVVPDGDDSASSANARSPAD